MKSLAYVLALCLFCPTLVVAQTPPSPLVSKKIAIPTFSVLAIKGPINVTIDAKTKPSTPGLQIFGDPKTVSAVTWKIKNHTLYLGAKWTYWPRQGDRLTIQLNTTPSQLSQIDFDSSGNLCGKGLTGTLSLTAAGKGHVNLYTKKLNLKSLYAKDKVDITLHNIASSQLTVQNATAGKVRIVGEADLRRINFTGNGNLAIYWINSPYLEVNANGQGNILLAGVAKTLDAHLSQRVHLFARQLRAEEGFIQTQNQARTEITITNKLSASAKDASVIYYARPVKFLNTYTKNTGVVLAN
jgi:hypothetical protein